MAHRGHHQAGHMGHHGQQQQQRMIGDYIVTQQIGSGSFAVVWKARHRLQGNEVAIKEIATEKLNPKLQESLMSEIEILKKTHHPNIIRLHDMVYGPNRIYLVLEYCTGGDLNAYIQRHGRVSEAVARHFMRQLGAGLQVLRANNLIHRDLKPQNLLLSTDDRNAVLKIADFGFARYFDMVGVAAGSILHLAARKERSLQPQGMAETICGSPLYMAPEILQRQKYNAKADLWSVGAILYQLVCGRPPFHGNSHVQLLLNIVRTNEVKFPEGVLPELHVDCIDMIKKLLRRNPVERLGFEEFFNHNFMHLPRSKMDVEGSPAQPVARNPAESSETSNEECFPFSLDDEHQGPAEVHSASYSKPPLFSASPSNSLLQTQAGTTGKFSVGTAPAAVRGFGSRNRGMGSGFEFEEKSKPNTGLGTSPNGLGTSPTSRLQKSQGSKSPGFAMPEERQRELTTSATFGSSKGGAMMDSMEFIEREYVLVGNLIPSVESLSLSASFVGKGVGSPQKNTLSSAPFSVTASPGPQASLNHAWAHGSPRQDTYQGPPDESEGPSPDPKTRLLSLKKCARLISELATDKEDAGQILESFAVQLVCLAIWKESLHVCLRWVAQAEEGGHGEQEEKEAAEACSATEREFSTAVDRAEEIALHVRALDGCTEMQDAMELIYQAALAVGRAGAVEELMGNVSNAAVAYAKAAALFYFILVEAPHLPINPPLVLSPSDRHRLRRYADSVCIRQDQCTMQREAVMEQHSSF